MRRGCEVDVLEVIPGGFDIHEDIWVTVLVRVRDKRCLTKSSFDLSGSGRSREAEGLECTRSIPIHGAGEGEDRKVNLSLPQAINCCTIE